MTDVTADSRYSFDTNVNCSYVYFVQPPLEACTPVVHSTVAFSDEILIDCDADGNPIGMELLDREVNIPIEALIAAYPTLTTARTQLLSLAKNV